MEKRYLSIKECKDVYGVSKDEIYKLINDGVLFKYKLSGTKIKVSELDSYMENQKGKEE